MPSSPIVLMDSFSADTVAPAAPLPQGIEQIDNHTFKVKATLPGLDSDGTPLTGLKSWVVASSDAAPDGSNAFVGLSHEQILAAAALKYSSSLSDADAGADVVLMAPILHLGGNQSFAMWCSDEVVSV